MSETRIEPVETTHHHHGGGGSVRNHTRIDWTRLVYDTSEWAIVKIGHSSFKWPAVLVLAIIVLIFLVFMRRTHVFH